MRKLILYFCLSSAILIAYADVNIYAFEQPQDETRFKELITELRCPKCQNQNLADSDAPLAQDLKGYVYTMVKAGKSDQEILGFMVERYGDFITYKPPVKPVTWFLWFAPGILLILTVLFIMARKRKTPAQTAPLTTEEKARLNALLQLDEHKS